MRLRPPTMDDAEAVLTVCVARDVADIGRPDFTLEDVVADWEAPTIDPARDCFVAEDDDGAIVAYAVIDHRGAVVCVHPDAEGRGAGTLLRGALEARAAERGQPVRQMLSGGNASGIAHVRAAGYRRTGVHHRMRIEDLAQAPAPPAAPAVRRFDLDADGEVIHALITGAFAEIPGNVDEPLDSWLASNARHEPAFRLAVDDDDGLAGALIGHRWEDGVGYVAELAVARRARGRGYGRALLLVGLRAFSDAGLTAGELRVNSLNATATRLYESVGMSEESSQEFWGR